MQNIVHSLQSSFVACACGKNATDCAVRWMERFIDGDASASGKSDLGPLIGAKRGVKTRVRGGVAMGGIRGVELVEEEEDVGADSPRRGVPPRLAARTSVEETETAGVNSSELETTAPPPKMRRGKGWAGPRGKGLPGQGEERIAGMRVDLDVGLVTAAGVGGASSSLVHERECLC